MPSTKEQRGGLESGAPEFPGVHRKGLKGTGSLHSVSPREVTLRGPGVPGALQNNPPSSDSQLAPASFLISFLLLLFNN